MYLFYSFEKNKGYDWTSSCGDPRVHNIITYYVNEFVANLDTFIISSSEINVFFINWPL